jgi:hypothetical protein
MSPRVDANHDQISSALMSLYSNWPGQSLPDSVKDTWRRKLETLRQGEFQVALDIWLDGPKSNYRPDVGAFMQIITGARAGRNLDAEYERTQRFLAGQRQPVQTSGEHVADVLTNARAHLGVERKPHSDRPEAKAAMLDEAKAAFRAYVEVATEGDAESQEAVDAWRALAAILGGEAGS